MIRSAICLGNSTTRPDQRYSPPPGSWMLGRATRGERGSIAVCCAAGRCISCEFWREAKVTTSAGTHLLARQSRSL